MILIQEAATWALCNAMPCTQHRYCHISCLVILIHHVLPVESGSIPACLLMLCIYILKFIYHHRYLGGSSCKGEGCDDIDNEIVRVTLHYKNPVKRPTVHHFTCQVTTNLVTQLGGQENVRRLQRLIKCKFRIVRFFLW